MDIASMLNDPARSNTRSRAREQLPPSSAIQRGFTAAPSYSLPTPSPEWMPSAEASESKHSRPRRAWDAGGYSLPLIPKAQFSPEANVPSRYPEDYSERPLPHRSPSDVYHSRQGSTDSFGAWSPEVLTPLDNSRFDRSTSSMFEPREYITRDRSFVGELPSRRKPSRSKSYSDQTFDVAVVGSKALRHKLSDSRSSFSSYSSSTFSGDHSRLSSMSTVNSAHFPRSLSTDVPMLDDMMEEVPTPTFPQGVVGGARSPVLDPSSSSSVSGRDLVSSPVSSQRNTKRKRPRHVDDQSRPVRLSPPLRTFTEDSELRQRVLEQARSLGLEVHQRLVGKPDICLFIENCSSRENIRKAISHIFGRNKVCTRRIPERVWVSVCRKHYQRTRYRQGAAYAKTQVHFVFSQIVRLLFWSFGYEEDDQVNAEKVTVTSWTFSIRKGELNRLAKANEESQTPHWVIENLGSGKSNEDIFNIALRLKSEIDSQILSEFPPIEFLPEVVELPTITPSSSTISPVEAQLPQPAEMSSTRPFPNNAAQSGALRRNIRGAAFANASQQGVPSRGEHWDGVEREYAQPLDNPYIPRRPRVDVTNIASTSNPERGMRMATENDMRGRYSQQYSLPTIAESETNAAAQASEAPVNGPNTTDSYTQGNGVFASYFSAPRVNSEHLMSFNPPHRLPNPTHPTPNTQSTQTLAERTAAPKLKLRGGATPASPNSDEEVDEDNASTDRSPSQSTQPSPGRPPVVGPPAPANIPQPGYHTIPWRYMSPGSFILFETAG